MARLSWENAGERYYETGIDRGVLYVGMSVGVPWQGLISVSESPEGGDPRPFYQDGIKYANLASAEEYKATINAFGAPPEFAPCDGMKTVQNGLFATQQPRKPFNLSYRSLVGNDTEGTNHAYKIHLVYNALAGPSQRENKSLGDSSDPSSYTWDITTLPPRANGLKPTAHFVIDSRYADAGALSDLEDILYGTDEAEPRIPDVDELLTIFA